MELLNQLGIDPKFILVTAVGFLCLVLILRKFAFGPIFGMLQTRQDTIRGNLDEAEARRVEMERLQHEYEARLARIEEEARDKIQAAVKDAQAARDEIIAKAQADSQAIVQRGYEEIERERAKAMAEMRNQIADLATSAASRLVRQNLNASNHAQLIDEVIGGIGSNGHARSTPGGGLR